MMLKKLTMLLLVCLSGASSMQAGIVDTINARADYCLSTWYSHGGFIAGGVLGCSVALKCKKYKIALDDAGVSAFLTVVSLGCYHLLRATISPLRCAGLLVPMLALIALTDTSKEGHLKEAVILTGSTLLGSVVCAAALNALVQKVMVPGK